MSEINTVRDAHEHVAHWRGARPGRSPGIWRWIADGFRANAGLADSRGRVAAAAEYRAIAEVFDAAAVEREREIAEQTIAYERKRAAEEAASDEMMRTLAEKRKRSK